MNVVAMVELRTRQGSLAVVCMEMGVQNSLRESGEKLGKPMNPYSILPF